MRVLATVIILVALLGANAMAQSQEPPQQTPQIHVDQNPNGAAKGQSQGEQNKSPPTQILLTIQQVQPENSYREGDNNSNGRAEQTSEYWPFPIVGHRLKITDSLLALFTFLLFAATVLLFISAEKAANAAKDSADTAKETLVASNRPWISISDPRPESQLTWEEKGARLTINFTIKNVGKSPAFDISAEVDQFVIGPENHDISAAVTRYCGEVRQRQIARAANGQHGEVLFPDESLPRSIGLLFKREEIEAGAKAMGISFFSPVVVICVDYRSPITKSSHATGLAYLILKPGPAPGTPSILPKPEETLAPNQFGLARSPFGSFAE